MPPDSSLTIGQRLYLIRLACGDGVRRPEPAADFSARVERATGKRYDQATISRLETGGRNWLVEDVDAFAAVDPLTRGRAWLAGYAEPNMGKDAEPPRPTAASEAHKIERFPLKPVSPLGEGAGRVSSKGGKGKR